MNTNTSIWAYEGKVADMGVVIGLIEARTSYEAEEKAFQTNGFFTSVSVVFVKDQAAARLQQYEH